MYWLVSSGRPNWNNRHHVAITQRKTDQKSGKTAVEGEGWEQRHNMSRFFQGQNVRSEKSTCLYLFTPVCTCLHLSCFPDRPIVLRSPGCLAQTGTVVSEEDGR